MTPEQASELLKLLEEGPPTAWWPFLLIPITTAIGAVLGFLTAVIAIRTQRSSAKRKNTLDAIMTFESDPVYRAAIATYRQFRAGGIGVEALTDPKNTSDETFLDQLNTFWNWHEAIALGLRRETLDEEIMLRWWGQPMVQTWNTSLPAINAFREKYASRRIFKNYEIVAREFARRIRQTGLELEFIEPEQPNALPYALKDGWFGRPPPISN